MLATNIDVNMPNETKCPILGQKLEDPSDIDINANYSNQENNVERDLDVTGLFDGSGKIEDYDNYLRKLKQYGQGIRSDMDQPNLADKPAWFDESLYKNAQEVYKRHLMAINFAHLSGLLLLVRVECIYRTLSSTGASVSVSKLFKRYYHTLRHVKNWYEGDIFDSSNIAHQSLLLVRGMHNKTSARFNCDNNENYDRMRAHISKYDLMLTQFAFIGFIVTHPKKVGMIDKFSRGDLISLLHFWRVIGYYLGVDGRLNLCSYELENLVGLCRAFIRLELIDSLKKNSLNHPPGIMSLNVARSVKFIPMLTFYGMMRHIYETIGHDRAEIDHKKTWYSTLSYNLIKLVMCTLLAYRPFRAFNNGLIRLSIYLVGKVEDKFASHLESSYGNELKA